MEQYGGDAIRTFILFAAPIEKDLEWNLNGIEGSFRFLNRIYSLYHHLPHEFKILSKSRIDHIHPSHPKLNDTFILYHQCLQNIDEQILKKHLINPFIASLMKLLNYIEALLPLSLSPTDHDIFHEILHGYPHLLFPIAPHLAEECFSLLGYNSSLYESPFPTCQEQVFTRQTIPYVIQINGKKRFVMEISADQTKESIIEMAKNQNEHFFKNKTIQKTIFVPSKLINFVIS